VVAGEDVLLLDHAAVQVAAEIDQGLFPGTDVLAVGIGPCQGASVTRRTIRCKTRTSGLYHGRAVKTGMSYRVSH
jgi:hypothetical protein